MGKKNKKAQRALYWLPCLLFLGGAAMLLYPHITHRIYQGEVRSQRAAFAVRQAQGMDPRLEELYQELERRNQQLYTDKQKDLTDPWSYQQPGIDLEEYGLEENIIGFLSIPKMEVELPIYLGASTENMAKGAVHLTETSYPIGGENTNSVIAAHRGHSKTRMFRDIQRLQPGDEVIIQNFKETLTYEVAELRVIEPNEIDQLLIQQGRDLLTLFTCHPYPQDVQRYVVFCQRKR